MLLILLRLLLLLDLLRLLLDLLRLLNLLKGTSWHSSGVGGAWPPGHNSSLNRRGEGDWLGSNASVDPSWGHRGWGLVAGGGGQSDHSVGVGLWAGSQGPSRSPDGTGLGVATLLLRGVVPCVVGSVSTLTGSLRLLLLTEASLLLLLLTEASVAEVAVAGVGSVGLSVVGVEVVPGDVVTVVGGGVSSSGSLVVAEISDASLVGVLSSVAEAGGGLESGVVLASEAHLDVVGVLVLGISYSESCAHWVFI